MSDGAPMVRHTVLVKFHDDTTAEQRAEFISRSQWSRKVDYVSGYVCGLPVQPNPYSADGTDDWDWGMSLDIAEVDVERYRDDPIHQAVGADVGEYAHSYAILDFVIDR